jgi:hypothetical protein
VGPTTAANSLLVEHPVVRGRAATNLPPAVRSKVPPTEENGLLEDLPERKDRPADRHPESDVLQGCGTHETVKGELTLGSPCLATSRQTAPAGEFR